MLLGGSLGSLVGGSLADKIGKKLVLILSFSLTCPLILLFLYSFIPWITIVLIGFFLLSSISVTIALGHEILPENKGLASSLNQGLAWTLASLFIPLVGLSIDTFGFFVTYQILAFLPLLALIILIDFSP
ncbi:Fosmidomycin resistance protein [archaeon HR06]|nr:Fosmidomycin resistance protein [archaeon HR06]